MISLISIAASTVINFVVYILKAVFSMLMWFATIFFKALKLLFCALPFTGISLFLLIITNIVILFFGSPAFLSLVPKVGGFELFVPSENTTLSIAGALKAWWAENVYSYHGTGAYIPLIFLTIIMFIPVVSVFLCISVISSFRLLIFCVIVLDIAIYLVRAIAGNGIVSQYLGRYYFLFPDSGKKHYEKSYEKWLKKHHEEFEDDSFGQLHERNERDKKPSKYDNFFEDPVEDEDDDFYEDYADDEYEDGEFEDDECGDGEFEDDEFEDDEYGDGEFEDDYDEDNHHTRRNASPATSFDFFAGCNSRESVEKKYRSLAKLYHPDNMDGDTASLQEINAQYENAKKRFPR